MKILTIIQLLFLSLLFINSNAQELINFDTDGYSISYPKGWTFDTSGQRNTSFIIFSKLEQNDGFRENVNLLIQDLSGQNLDLKKYTELSVNQIKSIPNSEVFESKDLKKDSLQHHQIVWEGFIYGKNLKFKQLYFVENNKAYILTLTCEQNKYEDYILLGTKILNSFTLK